MTHPHTIDDNGPLPQGISVFAWRTKGSGEDWEYTFSPPDEIGLEICEVYRGGMAGFWKEIRSERGAS